MAGGEQLVEVNLVERIEVPQQPQTVDEATVNVRWCRGFLVEDPCPERLTGKPTELLGELHRERDAEVKLGPLRVGGVLLPGGVEAHLEPGLQNVTGEI